MATAAQKVLDALVSGLPTGTYSIDPDGTKRYTLSDEDIRKLRGLISGVLKDTTGKPSFRVSRVDEAIIPALLQKWGIHLAAGAAGIFLLGRFTK